MRDFMIALYAFELRMKMNASVSALTVRDLNQVDLVVLADSAMKKHTLNVQKHLTIIFIALVSHAEEITYEKVPDNRSIFSITRLSKPY